MGVKNKSNQFSRILAIALTAAFGLITLAVIYGAFKQNTEGRSKAALEQTVVKRWEFNGKTSEGWEVQSPYRFVVGNGYLSILQGKSVSAVAITNPKVFASLPKGLKSVTFSLSVGTPIQKPQCPPPPTCTGVVTVVGQDRSTFGCDLYVCSKPVVQNESPPPISREVVSAESRSIQSGVMCALDVRACPDGSYVGRTGNTCSFENCPTGPVKGRLPIPVGRYSGNIYYKLVNKNTFEKPIPFSGVVDGTFRTITIKFPEIQGITVEQIKIVFSGGIRSTESIRFDWIRLGTDGINPSTPTPTVRCVPMPYCPPGAMCKMIAPPPGTMYCPTPTQCKEPMCPPPPVGCSYVNPTSCSCGALICSATVTPTVTPTGTPTGTPIQVHGFQKAIRINAGGAVYIPPILPRGEFTTEGWVKLDDFTSEYTQVHTIFKQGDYGSGVEVSLWVNGNKNISEGKIGSIQGIIWDSNGPIDIFSYNSISTNVWHHIALTKDSSTIRLFLDGNNISSKSYIGETPWSNSQGLSVGAGITAPLAEASSSMSDPLIGEIDDFRVSAKALYVANFTPPTMPYIVAPYVLGLYHFNDNSQDASSYLKHGENIGLVQYVNSTVR